MSASRVVEETVVSDEEISDITAEEEVVEQELAPEEDKPVISESVRNKFKDKGIDDILTAYDDLEKRFGRQGSEIGELRKLTDQMLQLQTQEKKEEPVEQKPLVDVDSLLDNPDEALSRAVANNPKIKAIEEQLMANSRAKAQSQFEQSHPDWKDVVNSTDFQSWVKGSELRTKLFVEADRNYDYQTGGELIDLYKQVHGKVQQRSEQTREKKLKAATVEKGSTNAKPSKVYRRADLINLRMNDPAKYDAMQDDIMAAYAEGRVR